MRAVPSRRSAGVKEVQDHPTDFCNLDSALTGYPVTPTSNILYAHEAHPFEAYRQLLGAMERYRKSMGILGGCRLVVTPLGSKLITLGASRACYEMRPKEMTANYGVAIPYAEPRRYVASPTDISRSRPEICSLLLTGEAYCGLVVWVAIDFHTGKVVWEKLAGTFARLGPARFDNFWAPTAIGPNGALYGGQYDGVTMIRDTR